MHGIRDMGGYLTRMQKSMLDKLFFADKIFEPVEAVVDFGCADGELLRMLLAFWEDTRCVGYDLNEQMLAAARQKLPEAFFTSRWEDLGVDPRRSLLNASSVIHEVYAYGTEADVRLFWQRVFGSGFRYVTIRDMMLSDAARSPADPADLARVRACERYRTQLADYECIWGPIRTRHDLTHYLLKYTYQKNWEREVRENYLPVTVEDLTALIPAGYRVIWREHRPLPYIVWQVKRDFGIDLKEPTHGKFVIERVD